jgi:hypothetical protein
MSSSAGVGGLGRGFPLFGGFSGLAAHLIKRYAPTAQFLTLAKEAFASIAFHEKDLVLVPELIPEIVEVDIVGSPNNVRKFMK